MSEQNIGMRGSGGWRLADWSISTQSRLPNLQGLVFEGFSYGSRYAQYNDLLCRSEGGYEKLSRAESPHWDLAQRHMDDGHVGGVSFRFHYGIGLLSSAEKGSLIGSRY